MSAAVLTGHENNGHNPAGVETFAHDLNNLLTTILGNVTLARLKLPSGNEVAQRLADAENAVMRARELTARFVPRRQEAPLPAPAAETRAGKRILVMDDEPLIQNLVSRSLSVSGYTVEVASNAETTLKAFAAAKTAGRPFDLVMLDYTIPNSLNGLQTFERLRQLDPEVRAVLSSGHSNDKMGVDPIAAGFAAVMPKPFRIGELLGVVRNVLNGAS